MSRIKSILKHPVITLMSGTTIAQAIPIAISPILTRMYTPEDFGVFTLFFVITTVFGGIVNARYELALMLPKKDEDAINIFALGLLIALSMSLTAFFLIVIFHDSILFFLNAPKIGFWLYFTPFSIFFIGFFNLLTYFNLRKKNYQNIARATIIKSIIVSIVQILVGLFKSGAAGLISAEIISRIFVNIKLFQNIITDKILVSKIDKKKIRVLAKKYKQFPQFSIWATLSNSLSSQAVSLFISMFYNLTTLGFYTLSERVLGVPSFLIGKSISQVFFQQAKEKVSEDSNITHIFNAVAKKLIIIGFILFGSLFFVVEDLFVFIFGEEWRIAGIYAQALTFLYFCRFVVSPLTIVPIILKKVNIDFYFQFILLLLMAVLVILGFSLNLSSIIFIYLFSFVCGLYYLMYFVYLNLLVRKLK